jgi:hypothetical protein
MAHFLTWGAANGTLSGLRGRVSAICILSPQNDEGCRLRNATQTHRSLTEAGKRIARLHILGV